MKDSEEYRRELLKKVKQDPIHLDTDAEMWEKVWSRISEEKPVKKSYFAYYASAAAVLLCLIAGIVYFKTTPTTPIAITSPDTKSIPKSGQEKTRTKEGETHISSNKLNPADPEKKSLEADQETIKKENETRLSSGKELFSQVLSDGSTVTLNSFTDLKVTEINEANFTSDLSGEAYFEIKPNKKRAFKVTFGNSYLMVLGTKFNVRSVKGESYQQVTVVEGIVKVYPDKNDKGMEVKSGEQVRINLDKNEIHLSKIDPLHYIAWKTGTLTFRKTPLEEVASALERVYKVSVVVENTVKACTFTGDLSQTPLEEALQIIEATTSLKIKRIKDNVHISGSPCN